jgi:hypothetical protein
MNTAHRYLLRHGTFRGQRHAAVLGEERQVLQVVLLNALVHVVDLSWHNNTDAISEEAGYQRYRKKLLTSLLKHMFSNTEHTPPG